MLSPAWRWLMLATLPAVALAGVHKHVKHEHWSKDYDGYFRKYTKYYFGPYVDWHWFKAQGIAESGLNPAAKSPVGARGIMQIMPSTYEEIKRKNPLIVAGIEEPRWNIAAGIYYDRGLYRKWKSKKVAGSERLSFAFASYNAGYGNVLKAFKRATRKHGAVKHWNEVAPFAPGETRSYVERIDGLMQVE